MLTRPSISKTPSFRRRRQFIAFFFFAIAGIAVLVYLMKPASDLIDNAYLLEVELEVEAETRASSPPEQANESPTIVTESTRASLTTPTHTKTNLSQIDVSQQRLLKTNGNKKKSAPADTVRTEFTLDGWQKGSGGGLDDGHRTVLGHLYFSASSVFEYGVGESTEIAAYTGIPRYTGVHTNATWVSQARENARMDHFRFHYADIGVTQRFSEATEEKDSRERGVQKSLYDYQIAPLVFEQKPFDVYLVDGMYRVNCACVSFLHAMKRKADMAEVRVVIHGGTGRNDDEDGGYDLMDTVADLEIKIKNLWVYKLKEGTSEDDLFALWNGNHDYVEPVHNDRYSHSRDSKFDLIAKKLYTRPVRPNESR